MMGAELGRDDVGDEEEAHFPATKVLADLRPPRFDGAVVDVDLVSAEQVADPGVELVPPSCARGIPQVVEAPVQVAFAA